MKPIRLAIALSAVVLAAAVPAQGQLRRTTPMQIGTYPASARAPRGMCQVWIDGVPARRQPAPTDCATARAYAPANAHIIYRPAANGLYDPRYDPRNGHRYPGEHGRNRRDLYERERAAHHDEWEHEHEHEHDREHVWRRGHDEQHDDGDDGDDGDDDEDDDDDHADSRYGTYGRYPQTGCVDVNRDGSCDYRRRAIGTIGSIFRLP